jgi:hypothetical protein
LDSYISLNVSGSNITSISCKDRSSVPFISVSYPAGSEVAPYVDLLPHFNVLATPVLFQIVLSSLLSDSPVLDHHVYRTAMMVDTGAEASLISDRIYRRIWKPPLLSSSVRLSGIIGTEHTTSLGGLPLQVRLSNGRTFSHTFHVAPNLSCGLLLAILLFVPCIFYLA